MKKHEDFILGLDIGTNSIGWAVVPCKVEKIKQGERMTERYLPLTCLALNSRIFPPMLDITSAEPKNKKRREARGARRGIQRLQERRRSLEEILAENGLLPDNFSSLDEEGRNKVLSDIDKNFAVRVLKKKWSKGWSQQEINHISPFAIRAMALEIELQPYELGRALYHLQRRRGYLSNRGIKYRNLLEYLNENPDLDAGSINEEYNEADDKSNTDDKKELGKVLGGLALLRNKLKDKTLAEYIWQESQNSGMSLNRITRYGENKTKTTEEGKELIIREGFYAERAMYKVEFDKIWEVQSKYKKFKSVLSAQLIKDIKYQIFYQRPLQSQKGKVGKCSFMPSKKRIHKATLEFQEYRIRQVINHIQIKGKPLDEDIREELYEIANDVSRFNERGNISWKEVAGIIGSDKKSLNFKPGLDEGNDVESYKKSFTASGLVGNRTAKVISDIIGINKWQSYSQEEKNQMVTDMLTIEDKVGLYKRLCGHWKLTTGYNKEAFHLAVAEFHDNSYAKHCSPVITKLLKYLQEGKSYYDACESAGFYEELIGAKKNGLPLDVTDIDNIANPIVQKALFEIRKVINSIYHKYGAPAVIRVELAREMKRSKAHRKEMQTSQEINRKNNAEADKEIIEAFRAKNIPSVAMGRNNHGYLYTKPKDRQKYKLWKNEQANYCPYCSSAISFGSLFSDAEIDHILPQNSFRDNYLNMVVCCKSCNQEKRGGTPYDTWGKTERWDHIIHNMEKANHFSRMPTYKKKRILREDFKPGTVEDFSQSQLRDTTYIATACKNMLQRSGIKVQVSKGGATSELRHKWGINELLPRHPDDEMGAQLEENADSIMEYDVEQSKKTKNRRDHRHHAVDALVIALTDHGTLQRLTKHYQQRRAHTAQKPLDFSVPDSWEIKKKDVPTFVKDKLHNTVVSHALARKVSGELHEDTIFSKSHYVTKMEIKPKEYPCLKDIQKYLMNDENIDGEGAWIIGENIRNILTNWVKDSLKQKPKDRKLPFSPSGRDLKTIAIAHRCYVVRKNLKDNLSAIIKYIDGEWSPGNGKWIADKQIHDSLKQWASKHKDNIKDALDTDPPKQLNKKGEEKEIIKFVRVAEIINKASIISLNKGNKTVKTGSNHHVEIFRTVNAEGEIKKRGRFISMFEAARRAVQRKPVIDKNPDKHWQGEWKFWMALSINDIIQFPEDDKRVDLKLGLPFYRVQKMTHRGGIIRFRHHSISSVEDDKQGHIQKAVNSLPDKVQKIEIGPLGITD